MKHLLLDVKIVAHRMSTVERCDRIVSFRDKSIHLTEGINHVTRSLREKFHILQLLPIERADCRKGV
jgi:ABC-type bacteriocin/lantibiotic exporter with double-glycine peptidase domain